MEHFWLILSLFFAASVLHSSAGFGGGSTYLAILSFFTLSSTELRPLALICNIAVTGFSSIQFVRDGAFNLSRYFWLYLVSVPLAFIGGSFILEQTVYLWGLCVFLLVSGLFLLLPQSKEQRTNLPFVTLPIVSAGVGFVSGLVGIGGGILLSPILNIVRYDFAKQIAVHCSLFILLNSVFAFGGILYNNNWSLGKVDFTLDEMSYLISVVLVGAFIGNRVLLNKFSNTGIKRITGVVVLFAAANIARKIYTGI